MNLMQKISKTNATLSEGQKRGDRVSAAGRVRCFRLDGSIQPPLVLGITDLPGTPIAQKADICLIVRRGFHTNVAALPDRRVLGDSRRVGVLRPLAAGANRTIEGKTARFAQERIQIDELPLLGVFALDSPTRPNPIGLTLVRFLRREGNLLGCAGTGFLRRDADPRYKRLPSSISN